MAALKTKSREVDVEDFIIFRDKAADFYDQMLDALNQERWSSVGLLAVHCAISMNDAVCCKALGQVSSGESHAEAARFLAKKYPSEEGRSKAGQLVQIINMKNFVEYEAKVFTEKNAREIFKRTERFYNWALKVLS